MNNRVRNPLLIIGLIFLGILIGYYLLPRSSNSFYQGNNFSQKLSYILGLINDDYVDEVDIDSLSDQAISSFLKQLDPHTSYINAADFKKEQESLAGGFEGIGIQFRVIEDTIVVIQPVAGGPSLKAGIMAGDRIVTVNDSNYTNKKIDSEDVLKLLRGKKGSKVRLGIKRDGVNKLISFNIVRDVIPTYSVDFFGMIDNKTGYIKLSQFSITTHDEVTGALRSMKKEGMQQLLFDLRGNGGGYLDQAIKVCDELLPEGDLIVFTKGRSRDREDSYATQGGLFEIGKIIILIDELSASASEIVSGAVQDNDRGMILGRRTFGKGLVQEQKLLPDGSALRLTVARYYTPSGRCIQRPYINGDPDKYFEDFIQRYSNMSKGDKDTIAHVDSLKFKTKSGRFVYGAGGIEPDVEFPYYNYKKGEYYSQLLKKGLLYKFCFDYVDKHRDSFKQYTGGDDYIKRFYVNNSMLQELFAFATKNGVRKDNTINQDIKEIMLLMKAYMAQSLYSDKYFYPIFIQIDEDIQKALPYFSKIK